MSDLLARVDKALGGSIEENAWKNFTASPIDDEGKTVQGIVAIATEQRGGVTVKVDPLTKPVTNVPLPS